MEPLISVITPVWADTEAKVGWLGELAESLFGQELKQWEWIVVDDCSPMPLRLRTGDVRVRAFRTASRQGPAMCRNAAAAMARGAILPVDADDKLAGPDALGALHEAWKRDTSKFVYGGLQGMGPDGQPGGVFPLPEYSFQRSLNPKGTIPVTALHSIDAHVAAGGWKPSLEFGFEDVEYWIAMGAAGHCGFKLDKVTLLYRRHDDSRFYRMRRAGQEQAMVAAIRQMHEGIYRGELPMGCCGGGGSKARGGSRAVARPPRGGPVTRLPQDQGGGKVWVEYLGDAQGNFQVRGEATREQYLIQGRGHVFEVWAVDAPRFQREGRGRHFKVGVPPPAEPEPEQPEQPEVVRPAPPAPEMATLERLDGIARGTFDLPEEPEPLPVPELVEEEPPPAKPPPISDLRPAIPRWGEMAEMLEEEQWTVEGLARANPDDLVLYPGIGPQYARRIVEEAKKLWARR